MAAQYCMACNKPVCECNWTSTNPEHLEPIATMTLERTTSDGDRLYTYPLRGHKTETHFNRATEQTFF